AARGGAGRPAVRRRGHGRRRRRPGLHVAGDGPGPRAGRRGPPHRRPPGRGPPPRRHPRGHLPGAAAMTEATPPAPPARTDGARPLPGAFWAAAAYAVRACVPPKRWALLALPALGAVVFGALANVVPDDVATPSEQELDELSF